MVSEVNKSIIIEYAKKYDVKAVYLFGSSLEKGDMAYDIDLAVEGIEPRLFFEFYGKLFMSLPKKVDLVDLSEDTRFNQRVRTVGIKIYEKD